ncbi:MAG TPA: hypothetical protein VGP07_05985 [Polyangia bacterium]
MKPDAERVLAGILSDRVRQAAKGRVDVITVGVDLTGDDRPEHVELVALYEVATQAVSWTGKSYPTSEQENSLIHVADLETHFLRVAGERVVVLGCHDLNMFNPRGWANQDPGGVRHLRCADMRMRTLAFRPTVILQHPHSTDTPNIWRNAWGEIASELPDVTAWASGIAYHRWGDEPRAAIERVLTDTQGGEPCVDFLVDAN